MPDYARGAGLLMADLLAHARGERLVRPRQTAPLPHHQTCVECGYDRWDGRSEHPRRGTRFARTCYGQKAAEAAPQASEAMIHELLALSTPSLDAPAPLVTAPEPETPKLVILGPAPRTRV